MSKAANFSFMAELPTYKTARHCCGFAKVTTLYFILTTLTVLQFILIAVSSQRTYDIDILTNGIVMQSKSNDLVAVVGMIFSVWVCLAITSFAGLIRKNPYMHLPLLTLEFLVSFSLLAFAGVGWFLFCINKPPDNTEISKKIFCLRAAFLTLLLICHAYYAFVIYSLFADVKSRRDTEKFIARQKMFDDVCEEMIWEEGEAEKYHGNTSLTMSGVYYQESMCYSNGSITSCEMNSYYLDTERTPYSSHYQHQHPKRYVTYYDEDEDSY